VAATTRAMAQRVTRAAKTCQNRASYIARRSLPGTLPHRLAPTAPLHSPPRRALADVGVAWRQASFITSAARQVRRVVLNIAA